MPAQGAARGIPKVGVRAGGGKRDAVPQRGREPRREHVGWCTYLGEALPERGEVRERLVDVEDRDRRRGLYSNRSGRPNRSNAALTSAASNSCSGQRS